jgi:hypothetical protein
VRWVFCLATLLFAVSASFAFGQAEEPPTESGVASAVYSRGNSETTTASVNPPERREAPATLCPVLCIESARQCGTLAASLQGSTNEAAAALLADWGVDPARSPDPACVQSYGQCRRRC